MIVRTLSEIMGTQGETHGPKWHSMRLLSDEDGFGVLLADTIIEAGFEKELSKDVCQPVSYCIEGTGQIEESKTNSAHVIRPGTLCVMDGIECPRLTTTERMRFVSIVCLAPNGFETQ